ncbi:hypothetical protein CDAR_600851 [Caerostris darwini]|uniref:Uncharacterized protein n=1 Tax=Caerostris darwini TaxID=1538125 RepID=A0AAV4TV91_9ARAC|nr:hypothetical protein CDAR_600851 [Caerostris darwini]
MTEITSINYVIRTRQNLFSGEEDADACGRKKNIAHPSQPPPFFSKRSGSKMIFPGSSRVHPQPPAGATPCATWRRLDSSRNVSVRLFVPCEWRPISRYYHVERRQDLTAPSPDPLHFYELIIWKKN